MIIFACRKESPMSTLQESSGTMSSRKDSRYGEFVHGLRKLAKVTCHRSSGGNNSAWLKSAPARLKVLNPLTSVGPSMHAEICSMSETGMVVRVPRGILVGSTVRVRMGENVAFGEVRSSNAIDSQFEIGVEVLRSS